LAASSIGFGAGLYLAGLPRLVTAAAVTPAVVIGAAIILRPAESSAMSSMMRVEFDTESRLSRGPYSGHRREARGPEGSHPRGVHTRSPRPSRRANGE